MLSISHLILVLLIVMLLFGAGKLPKIMGDLGKGIKNLRDELGNDTTPTATKMDEARQQILPPEDKTPNH